jgi:putative acetyltransferase
MLIRPETSSDYAAIQTINIDAFAQHPFSHQTEHLIVNALRDSNALTISLVAEDQGVVVGHIAFSPALIDGADLKWFTLGPVAVSPDRQRQGIGALLIKDGLKALRQLGAQGCLLVGDPNYYKRFGFLHSQILSVHDVPAEYFLCLSFITKTPKGIVTHHPAFFVTA